MKIKMKRKTAVVLECAMTFIAYALFALIDWRLFVAMFVLEIANGISDVLENRGTFNANESAQKKNAGRVE